MMLRVTRSYFRHLHHLAETQTVLFIDCKENTEELHRKSGFLTWMTPVNCAKLMPQIAYYSRCKMHPFPRGAKCTPLSAGFPDLSGSAIERKVGQRKKRWKS